MPSDLRNANAIQIAARQHLPLRLVPAIQPKVLIVEDHDDSREMLRLFLEMKNCFVSEARDGLEAVDMAIQLQPDVILMDVSLPLIDGLEATRRIRVNKWLHETFILAMNGWGTPGYSEAAVEAGCDCCLLKPIDFGQLESFLARYFPKTSSATGSGENKAIAIACSPHLVS